MKVYISGRIKDYRAFRAHFRQASHVLRVRHGFEIVNPCDLVPDAEDPSYEDFMLTDLRELLLCDAIYMLEGWERSVGARCEHQVAAMCGLEIMYEPKGEFTPA